MQFMFSNPQKFILSSSLKDAKAGLNQNTNLEADYKKHILTKIDRTLNQLDYNSYISNISEEVAGQFYQMLLSVQAVLQNTDTTQFDDDQKEDLNQKMATVLELTELFLEYSKYLDKQENALHTFLVQMQEKNRQVFAFQKCAFCDEKAYYRVKRFGKVCKMHRDQIKKKATEIKESVDNAEYLDDTHRP